MPPPIRQRFNSKARQSTLGGSSHKKRRKSKSGSNVDAEHEGEWHGFENGDGDEDDGMDGEEGEGKLDMIGKDEQVRKREERAAAIRKELEAQGREMSSKKRKRLDAFITKQLKKESRAHSLSLIALHSNPPSLTSHLKSTSTLGQHPTAPLSALEKSERREDLEVRRAMGRVERRGGVGLGEVDEDDGLEGEGDGDGEGEGWRERKRRKRGERNGLVVMAEDIVMEGGDGVTEGGDGETGTVKAKKAKKAKKEKNKGDKVKKDKWGNPLLSAENGNESDFDSGASSSGSSDSDNEEDIMSTKAEAEVPQLHPPSQADLEKLLALAVDEDDEDGTSAPNGSTQLPLGSALAKKSDPGLGSALKRDETGVVVLPKVVFRSGRGSTVRMTGAEKRQMRRREEGLGAVESGEEDMSEGEDQVDEESDEDEDMDSEAGSEELDEDEEDSEVDSDEDDSELEESAPVRAKRLGPISDAARQRSAKFIEWANKQVTPNSAPDLLAMSKPLQGEGTAGGKQAKVLPKIGPLGAKFEVPKSSLLAREGDVKPSIRGMGMGPRPTIKRRPSVDASRAELPVVAEEQPLMEAIMLNRVVVVCGETGSGKTTQVPQMLYEAGFGFPGSDNPGMIAITQPRRVAAVSLAVRVASELNQPATSRLVAHQIRYSSTTSKETAIKFMTDGVLLRELAADFLLKRYSVVVVDEAHERGVNTDVLIGVLSRVAKLREKMWREKKDDVKPLRIVIMSATLRVSDFAENPTLFAEKPPVIEIAARQYPVTVHFNRKTVNDYVTEAYKKVAKIHARLPSGGVLVFLTGQGEITALCRKLERKFGKKAIRERESKRALGQTMDRREEEARIWELGEVADDKSIAGRSASVVDAALEVEDLDVGYDEDLAGDVDDGEEGEADPEALDTDDEGDEDEKLGIDKEESDVPLHVLPLYSLLPNEQQLKVFDSPPAGHRLVIVATNVAETSLTIPGIKYVVDSGRVKERQYDPSSGVQTFQVGWVSKASAAQRSGRAGRTGPGHCYRLYSSAFFENHFASFSEPEILRMPIEGTVLQMKSMNIDAVVNFPFPTAPDRIGLRKAEALLTHLGALEAMTATTMVRGVEKIGTVGGRITTIGTSMAAFPVTPRYAKMLVIGSQHGCLPYVIAMVAALSVGDPFLREEALNLTAGEEEDQNMDELTEDVPEMKHIRSADVREKEERRAKRRAFYQAQQRHAALGGGSSDLFRLIAVIGAYDYSNGDPDFFAKNFVRAKAMKEIQQLRQQINSIAQSHMPGQKVDVQAKLSPPNETQLKVLRQVLCAGFIDQVAVRADLLSSGSSGKKYETTKGVAYKAAGVPEEVFIHPGSSLAGTSPPDWIVYGDVVRTSKVWLKTVTKINPAWLSSLGKSLCTFSRPLDMPSAASKLKSAMKGSDEKREAFVVPHYADLAVDLPAMNVMQRKEKGRWITEL